MTRDSKSTGTAQPRGRASLGRRIRLSVLVAILLASAACSPSSIEPEPPRLVRTEIVTSDAPERARVFSGTARSSVESRLSFRVPGALERLAVRVGDRVVAGQTLAQLDARDYQLQVQEAQAALRQAEARARNAESQLKRVRAMYENRNASRAEYDAARTERDSASAQVVSLENKLELARSRVDYTTLKAPVAGAINQVSVEVNENVQAGQMVAVLSAGQSLEVRVAVPEAFISLVREGQPAVVRFDVQPGTDFTAVVSEVAPASTGIATTYPVTVRITDTQKGLRAGMVAEVELRLRSGSTPRIVVPAFAVGEDREGRFTYVVDIAGDGAVAHRRAVRVGDLVPGGLEIVEGLRDGDKIVTAGVSLLRDGMEVRVESGAGTAP